MQIETGSVVEEEGVPAVLEANNEVVDQFLSSKPGKGTILAEYEHGQSASSAYWDPSGTRIVSTSYDDRLRGAFSLCVHLESSRTEIFITGRSLESGVMAIL